ncbi:MAG TPA: transposase [Thermoanaerobaculia bacterium]
MPVKDDTFATRRHLPHLQRPGRSYFVTFSTREREVLVPAARDIVYETVIREHGTSTHLYALVVMPDHVHFIATPYSDQPLPDLMQRIKSVAVHRINRQLHRSGPLWQDESFDRIVRSDENLRKKGEYLCANPVRAGLVADVSAYRWIWREWVEGQAGRLSSTSLSH